MLKGAHSASADPSQQLLFTKAWKFHLCSLTMTSWAYRLRETVKRKCRNSEEQKRGRQQCGQCNVIEETQFILYWNQTTLSQNKKVLEEFSRWSSICGGNGQTFWAFALHETETSLKVILKQSSPFFQRHQITAWEISVLNARKLTTTVHMKKITRYKTDRPNRLFPHVRLFQH